jgi:GTPase SAR1 family protein
MDNAIKIRAECRHFRVLIIGRANSGKTTILKKVCQTTDNPRIYDPEGGEVWETTLPDNSSLVVLWLINGQIDMSIVKPSEQVRYEHGQLESLLDIDGLLSFSVVIMISTTK